MNIQPNPNPTNSEMDSKTIIKHPRLNDGQRSVQDVTVLDTNNTGGKY